MKKLRLMFRWTFVFVLLGMLHVHANVYPQNGQQVTLSMKAASLKDVLWAIERQTSFVFMYNEEDLDKIGKVDVDVQGDDIRTILNVCLRNTNLTYVLQDEVIVIKPEVQSQKVKEVRIKGTVKDEKGHLLPGVTVFIKLVVIPLVFLPIAVLAGSRGPSLLALALAWETPVAVSSYIMAQQAGADGELAGQLVVLSAACCIPTVFLMIFVLQSMALL